MIWFAVSIAFTLGVSFLCSFLEALILSTSVTEVEALKKKNPKRGLLLERHKLQLDETISSILTLNTIANTLGSMVVGALAIKLFDDTMLGLISGLMTLGILVFSEVIPKNLGVAYRVQMQPHVVLLLHWMRQVLVPVTYLCSFAVRMVVRHPPVVEDSDQQIILLAEKSANDGTLSRSELNMIANALTLDDVRVSEIMTPRTVVMALNRSATVGEVFRENPSIPFARMPVYEKNLDTIVGMVRRRDLLKAKANDQDFEKVGALMQEIHFVPETVTAAQALQLFLRTHQQLAVAVDEFGSVAGVITMEDVIEQILGREIFEKDDVAVDMRELARAKLNKQNRASARRSSSETSA